MESLWGVGKVQPGVQAVSLAVTLSFSSGLSTRARHGALVAYGQDGTFSGGECDGVLHACMSARAPTTAATVAAVKLGPARLQRAAEGDDGRGWDGACNGPWPHGVAESV